MPHSEDVDWNFPVLVVDVVLIRTGFDRTAARADDWVDQQVLGLPGAGRGDC